MAGVQSKPQFRGALSSLHEGSNRGITTGVIVRSVRSGIQFNAIDTRSGGMRDLFHIRGHEHRGADPVPLQGMDHLRQEMLMSQSIPTGIAGENARGVGHQRHLMGPHLQDQVHELWTGIAFDIELGGELSFQVPHITATDMPFIRSRMNSDPLGSPALDIQCQGHHIGNIAPARIAQCGELVDIDAETGHGRMRYFVPYEGPQK